MEKHFNSFTIYFKKKLNEYSLFSFCDLKFISFIEENSINIKALDDISNYSSETKYLYLIDDIKKKTIFDYFHNNTWTELVENVQLNFYIRKQFKNNFTNIYIPSKKLMKLIIYSFKNIFETDMSEIILQFLSTT